MTGHILEQFKKAPFNLGYAELKWVSDQFNSMDLEARVSHLFNMMVMDNAPETLAAITALQPGAVTKFFGPDLSSECQMLNDIRDGLAVPPLISADIEGGSMSLPFGTPVPNQLGMAALNDPQRAEQAMTIMAREARQLGLNWSFTPVIDVDDHFRSAIVGTRSYGSDTDAIAALGQANIRAFQSNGLAATAKHWPGDGQDDRDQHLVTSVNDLPMDQWQTKYGHLFRTMIEAGVKSIMSAHIALPEYMKTVTDDPEEWYRPASLNHHLNIDLLRGELGFNGLIVSDASTMAGASSWADRATVLADTIENGCDMILFNRNPAEDFALLMNAVRQGRVSERRLNESVLRILALKASLGLAESANERSDATELAKTLKQPDDVAFAQQAMAEMPTLVKDRHQLRPLTVEKHRRVLVFSSGIRNSFTPHPMPLEVPDLLKQAGFDVTLFQAGMRIDTNDYDCVLYLLADESSLLKSRIYIDWRSLCGGFEGAMERYWNALPAVMISFGYPYHLYDAPRIPTYINAYCALPDVQRAVVKGLTGQITFNQYSPVDAFCGREQLRY